MRKSGRTALRKRQRIRRAANQMADPIGFRIANDTQLEEFLGPRFLSNERD
jgi:hypothetical protein